MKKAIISYMILLSLPVFAQKKMELTNLKATQLPKGITYKGTLKTAVRWTDKLGDNLVITTVTGETASKSPEVEDSRDASLYAMHYLVFKDSVSQVWKVSDYVKECPFDIILNFIGNTFHVTDLNQDGIGEIWLMYKASCRSDVSPVDMKIIMYEGKQKYAMRGQNIVEPSKGESMGGDYKFDKAFDNGAASFRDFAKKLWKENSKQVWE
ncbi:hypothetical protein D3C87_95710 [compost metagenome]